MMRCYMPPIVLLLWALLLSGGLDPEQSLIPFVITQALAWWLHIKEMRARFDRMYGHRHDD